MKSYVFRVELERDEDLGVWSAIIPLLPGCAVDEDTAEAALEALQEAAEMFVEFMLERGDSIPIEPISSGTDEPIVAVNVGVGRLVS